MKIIILLSYVILNYFSLLTESATNNDSLVQDSTKVTYFTNDFNNFTLGTINDYDTVTLLSSFYDPIDSPFSIYQTLSNSGLASKEMIFTLPATLGFNTNVPSFEPYLNNSKEIIFPIIYQPFSEIKYMMGDKKEQHLEILFSREFLPRFFLTLNYDIDFSPGVYKRSKMQNSYFNGNFRYNSKNNRYGVMGSYYNDKIDVQENGGILNDSDFIDNIETDKSIIDVNLIGATNLVKESGVVISQYFNILEPGTIKSNNNQSKFDMEGLGRINHRFSYQNNKLVYEDTEPLSLFYNKFDSVLDSINTFDSIHYYNVKNVLFWNTLGYKKYNDDIPFYLTFGIEHNYSYHAGYVDLNTLERFNEQKLSNLSADAGVIINLFKSTRISGNAKLIVSGYQAGDFYIKGQWRQYLGTTKKNLGAIKFNIDINRQSPDWFEEFYYSNNFRWDNDFKPSTSLLLDGSYELPFMTIGIKNTTIDDYIFFGKNVKPEQYIGAISISSLYSTFNAKLNKFEVIGYASLNTTTNSDIIHLPVFQTKIKLAYNINLVKNISMMQPSIVINYFTEYYADAYMPALRLFYLQDNVKIGNFPYIDLCVTFKVRTANIFIQYTNMYSLTKDNRYFTTPHYPMRDSRFCLGVNWRLYK